MLPKISLKWLSMMMVVVFIMTSASTVFVAGAPKAPILSKPAKNAVLSSLTPSFNWRNAGARATSFSLEISTDSLFSTILYQIDVKKAKHTLPDGILEANRVYYWRVMAHNAAGDSPWSQVRNFSTPPDAVHVIMPGYAALLEGSVNFIWSRGSNDAPGYQLQVGKSKSGSSKIKKLLVNQIVPAPSDGNTVTYNLASLNPGTYYWHVRAVGVGPKSYSPWSATYFFTVITGVPTLKIALLAPITGAVNDMGLSSVEGTMMAVDEWNKKGGLLGYKITAVIEDTQCSGSLAGPAATKVINTDGVHYIIGDICSGGAKAVAEVANPAGVVQISPTASHPNVTIDGTGATYPYVFRACFIDPYQGKVAADFSYNDPGIAARKAFVFRNTGSDWSQGLSANFIDEFSAQAGTASITGDYTDATDDFGALLDTLIAYNPGIVYLPDFPDSANKIAAQAKARGIQIPFVGGDVWEQTAFNRDNANGWFFTTHFSAQNKTKAVKTFVKNYGARYKDDKGKAKTPDSAAALSYDSTNLMLQAILTSGADDPAVVKTTLANIDFTGVSGNIKFDDQHNPQKSAVIIRIINGDLKFYTQVNP